MSGFNRRDFIKTVGAGTAAFTVPVDGTPSRTDARPAASGMSGMSAASAAPVVPTVLSEIINASGSWQVTASALGWTFSGSVGSPATGITTASGTDTLGAYTETTFTYQAGARKGGIRVYDAQSTVIFTDTYVKAAANATPGSSSTPRATPSSSRRRTTSRRPRSHRRPTARSQQACSPRSRPCRPATPGRRS